MTRATVTFVTTFSGQGIVPREAGSACAVMAHRGASRAEVENTVVAFRRAAEMGADGVELDVRRTRDGALVVHHDPKLADGRSIVETDAGDLPPHVPSLADALEACAPLWVNVEIKNDPAEPDFDPQDDIAVSVIDHLVAHQPSRRILISSFRRETIDRCHALAPDIATAWLTPGIADDRIDDDLDDLVRSGHAAVHPWHGLVTQRLVNAAHARGLLVNVWTCDEPERMLALAAWGVDGICTNVPDVALTTLGR